MRERERDNSFKSNFLIRTELLGTRNAKKEENKKCNQPQTMNKNKR